MNKAFIFMSAIAIANISGCASSSKTFLPDGREGYTINCSGSALSWDLCYSKAGELCKERGYQVIARDGESGMAASANQGLFFAGTTANRSMLIQCK